VAFLIHNYKDNYFISFPHTFLRVSAECQRPNQKMFNTCQMALQNGQRYLKFVNGHKFVEVNIKPRQRQIIQQLGKLTAYWR